MFARLLFWIPLAVLLGLLLCSMNMVREQPSPDAKQTFERVRKQLETDSGTPEGTFLFVR